MDDERRFLNHNCVDCNKRIAKGASRCRPCHDAWCVGENHQKWKGGRYVATNGYVYISGARLAGTRHEGKNQAAEHTLVMESHLGRDLRRGESVHHKNGVRHDNRLSNLELWVKSQPAGQRVADVLAWAHEVIERYEDERIAA